MAKKEYVPDSTPMVSVVVPHQGDDAALKLCLEGLRAQDYPKKSIEIIIVVNEAIDRDLEFPLGANEQTLWEPQGFSYRARNTGISHAEGSVIMLTDSDTVPEASWISLGVAALQSGTDIVAGHVTVTRKSALNPLGLYEALFAFDQEKNARHGYCATANLVTHRFSFDKYGQFREEATTGEDFEWTYRATRNGANLRYHSEVRVNHPARETLPSLLAKARRTTAPFVGLKDASPERTEVLRRRVSFAVGAKPSESRTRSLTLAKRTIARIVRLFLQIYKLLCLLRVIPASNRHLDNQAQSTPTLRVGAGRSGV